MLQLSLDGKSLRQRCLPQCLRVLQVGIDLGFDFTDDGQVAVNLSDHADLFSKRGRWHRYGFKYFQIDILLRSC